jgi:hypothetical protein
MSDRTYARFFRNGVPRSTNLVDALALAEKS